MEDLAPPSKVVYWGDPLQGIRVISESVALSGSGVHDGDFLEALPLSGSFGVPKAYQPVKGLSGSALITRPRVVSRGGLLPNFHAMLVNPFVSSMKIRLPTFFVMRFAVVVTRKAPKAHQPVKGLSASLYGSGASLCDLFLPDAHSASLGARRMLSNQGESSGSGSGSGGRAGGDRNGGGEDGNQGIGGGVGGGGGQREGIGNERRGNRGRNHGGGNGNGDDDGNDRRGLLGYIGGERAPMGLGPYGLAEILLPLNAEMIWTLGSHDIHDLSARARIYRVVSLAFNSVALVCLSASIGQRRTNPIRATILSWIGSFATLLGLISMIAMAFSASFIP